MEVQTNVCLLLNHQDYDRNFGFSYRYNLVQALGVPFLIVASWISDFFFFKSPVTRQDTWLFTRCMGSWRNSWFLISHNLKRNLDKVKHMFSFWIFKNQLLFGIELNGKLVENAEYPSMIPQWLQNLLHPWKFPVCCENGQIFMKQFEFTDDLPVHFVNGRTFYEKFNACLMPAKHRGICGLEPGFRGSHI